MPSDDFNLDAPPNFQGLHPERPIEMYHRHLPHWRQRGATYFVTFRLADSIPQEHLTALKRWREIWEKENPPPRTEQQWERLAREITSRCDAWMDEGYGECVFQDAALAKCMEDSLRHFQDTQCFTSCYAVMPNHVHAVMMPRANVQLQDLLGRIKAFVSRHVNKTLGRSGSLWASESYDRIVRDEEHLYRVVQYIGRNPRKAGIPQEAWIRWIHPDWVKAGWRFEE